MVFIAAVVDTRVALVGGISVLFIALLVTTFNRLTVTVGSGEVRSSFGWGWPRRVIALRDITGFQVVRNRWYYGWGIRWVPRGSMFNVWGLDAVELLLASGRRFRIGSDQPHDLAAALTLHTSLEPGAPSR